MTEGMETRISFRGSSNITSFGTIFVGERTFSLIRRFDFSTVLYRLACLDWQYCLHRNLCSLFCESGSINRVLLLYHNYVMVRSLNIVNIKRVFQLKSRYIYIYIYIYSIIFESFTTCVTSNIRCRLNCQQMTSHHLETKNLSFTAKNLFNIM